MTDVHSPTNLEDANGEVPPGARKHERAHPPRRALRIVLWSLLVLLLAVAGVAAWFTLTLNNSFNQAEKLSQEEVFPDEVDRPAATETGALNILLLGSDTRGELDEEIDDIRGQRSDTIMIAHISSDRESVQVMSIMRDNWVEIPGHGFNKINAAMSFGGVPLVVQTVEEIIDSRIDHVAIIDFEGFQGLTDALGGVTVNNPREFTTRHGNISFAAGEITLTGEQALRFVRERYAFADGDYSRVANQQLYMKSVVKQILSRDTLTSPTKVLDSVDAFAPFMKVDSSLTASALASLGYSMSGVRSEDISFFTSPTLGTGMVGSASVVKPDWDELDVVAQAFRDDTLGEYLKNRE